MTAPLLSVRDLGLRFGAVTAFSGVSFDVHAGELFAVIGPNGAGKSSLFNALSRVYEPDAGAVELAGKDFLRLRPHDLATRGVARSFQNLGVFAQLTALENVLVGRHHLMRAGVLRGGMFAGLARREEREHRAAALEALDFVGIAEHAQTEVQLLPYGHRKRVELARCLAMDPVLMLLDEPVAGMTAGERGEITELIRRVRAERDVTLLLVEHDMGMVMQVADRILVLDFGEPIALGTPQEIQSDERVIRAYLGEELEVGSPGEARRMGAPPPRGFAAPPERSEAVA